MNGNILVIGDLHAPFNLKDYLDFCYDIYKSFGCKHVISIGDMTDNHAISYHEKDPDGLNSKYEFIAARKELKRWSKLFPKMKICLGNHDLLPKRRIYSMGLPSEIIKTYNELWNTPKTWEWGFEFYIQDIKFFHGDGYSGLYPHANAARKERQNCVIGHNHAVAGIEWYGNEKDRIFGMCTGCGVDRKSYALQYGKNFARKPFISCGVIAENGKVPILIPMEM